MEVKKTIKRVIAVAAGATMLGATMFSALAASDLSAYPSPFVKDGKFDAFIVVGDKAAAEDVVGAVDIGASLQFEMKKDSMVSSGSENVMISDGVKIKGTGSEVLNYGEYIGEVRTSSFDSEDLPVLLADGRYVESEGATDNDETYTQTILLNDPTSGTLGGANGLAQFTEEDDFAPKADNYLYLNYGDTLYRYALEFDNPVQFDATSTQTAKDDIEGTQIEIQGNLYTITDIKLEATGSYLTDMTLMAGDTLLWLMQDQIVEKTISGVKHEIKVVDVTETEDSCGVSVDGYVAWIDTKSDKVINGVDIGVLDAKAVHAQLQDVDICELNIGATEIKIKGAEGAGVGLGNGDLTVDGMDIDGALVTLVNDGVTAGDWLGLSIDYTPEEEVYLANGTEFRDPALNNFKFLFGGVSASYEAMSLERTSSRKGMLKFENSDGKQVEMPLQVDTAAGALNTVTWGLADDKPILMDTNLGGVGTTWDCTPFAGNVNAKDCKRVQLYAIATAGCTAHVIEVTNVDIGTVGVLDDVRVDLKDLTYGRTWNDKIADSAGTPQVINLGSLGTITIDLGVAGGSVDGDGNIVLVPGDLSDPACNPNGAAAPAAGLGWSETSNGAWIVPVAYHGGAIDSALQGGLNDCNYNEICNAFILYEDDNIYDDTGVSTASAGLTAEQEIDALLTYDSITDNRLEIQVPSLTANAGGLVTDPEWHASGITDEADSDVDWYVTFGGTKMKYNSDSKGYLDIWYPDGQVEFNAFLAPVAAQISTTGGNIKTVTLDKINVGAARLASEISDVTKDNLILVGGACANAATATVEGVSSAEPDCIAGLQSGEAVIKLYDQSTGKVAMVVAGMSAMDTRRATRVVSNFGAYSLKGGEAKVTGTSLTDIKVSMPS